MSLLDTVRERRQAVQTQIDALLAQVETEKRTALTTEEGTKFTELRAERDELHQRETQLAEEETRRQADADAAKRSGTPLGPDGQPRAHVTAESRGYESWERHSYFLDLARVELNRGDGDGGVAAARDRLARHAKVLEVDLPAREARRKEHAEAQVRAILPRGYDGPSPFERRVNPNRVDGQGGYFVPPLWLIDQYAALARAGRPFLNVIRNMELPGGTDSINIPKVNTGTRTDVQTADAGGVASQDLTDTFVTAPVRTVAGQQDLALQLLDQSPVAFDEIVFGDLNADYNMRLDIQAWRGSGVAGQVKGIDNVSGANLVTYTDASPTVPELYAPLAQAQSLVGGTRFLPATAIFAHGRRWFWMISALDTQNRPLVLPRADIAVNPEALQNGTNVEGIVGDTQGLPIVADWNIATTLGAGVNQDRMYTLRTSDIYLWEGAMRSRTLTEVLSGTLQVRLQIYNYVAFMADRYPASIGIIDGTGLAAPAGF